MPVAYTHTIFGRPVRFEGELAFVRFETTRRRPGGEMPICASRLRQLAAMFPGWRLGAGRYKDGRIHPVLRKSGQSRALSRDFAWLCGHREIAFREVRVLGRPIPEFLSANLSLSERGRYCGMDVHQELARRWRAVDSGDDPNRVPMFQRLPEPPQLKERNVAGVPRRGRKRASGAGGVFRERRAGQ